MAKTVGKKWEEGQLSHSRAASITIFK